MLNPALSKLSGTDILTALKSDSLTAAIPLFLLVTQDIDSKNYMQADGCLTLPIKQKSLIKILPLVKTDLSWTKRHLTILHLYPESETTSNLKITHNADLNFALHEHLSGLNHRVLEADSSRTRRTFSSYLADRCHCLRWSYFTRTSTLFAIAPRIY